MTKAKTGLVKYGGEGPLTDDEIRKLRRGNRITTLDLVRLFGEDFNWYNDEFSKAIRAKLRQPYVTTTNNDILNGDEILCPQGGRPALWMLPGGADFDEGTLEARFQIKEEFKEQTGGTTQFLGGEKTRDLGDGVTYRLPDFSFID